MAGKENEKNTSWERRLCIMKKLKSVWLKICLVCLVLGIVFAVTGFCMEGGKHMSKKEQLSDEITINETYTDVKNIEISLEFTNLEIKQGEKFSVSGIGIKPEKLEMENRDGSLKISRKSHNFFNNFGIFWDDNELNIGFTDEGNSKLIVTVPKETHFDDVSLEVGAGSLTVSNLYCENLEVSVGAGEGTMENISVTDCADVEVGAGTLSLQNVTANELELEAGMGEIVLDGMVEKSCAANCGMGKIVMNLKDNIEEYKCSIECGMGKVKINDENYSGFGTEKEKGNGEKILKLECGMGNIKVQIQP